MGAMTSARTVRTTSPPALRKRVARSPGEMDWTAAAVSESVATDTNPRFEDVTTNFGPQHPGAQFYRLGVTLGN